MGFGRIPDLLASRARRFCFFSLLYSLYAREYFSSALHAMDFDERLELTNFFSFLWNVIESLFGLHGDRVGRSSSEIAH